MVSWVHLYGLCGRVSLQGYRGKLGCPGETEERTVAMTTACRVGDAWPAPWIQRRGFDSRTRLIHEGRNDPNFFVGVGTRRDNQTVRR